MGNRIELAKSARSKCVTCDVVIPKGGVRLAEEYHDIGIPEPIHRYYHLKCAAAVHPELVGSALQHVDRGVEIPDRAEIEAKVAPAIQRATDLRKEKYLALEAEKAAKQVVVVAADDTTIELLAQLAANPEDPGTLAVVADQLQARGDIRGELIALQLAIAANTPSTLALEGADDEETDAADLISESDRRSRRCATLLEKLAIPLDPGDRCVWGVGFIRRLELLDKTGTRLSALAPIWSHASLRFLSELRITFQSSLDSGFVQRLGELVPRTVRVLELGASASHALAGIAELIPQLPRLDTLALTGRLGTDVLAHPTLRKLEIGTAERHETSELPHILPKLSPKQLPGLVELVLAPGVCAIDNVYQRDRLDTACASLGARWFKQLTHVGWLRGSIDEAGVTQLAKALGKRRLARLDLTGTKVPLDLRDRLARLCDELVAPDLAIGDDQTVYIEHANKPEWGRGRLVSKKEGKLEVEFPKPVGKKVFKADAPFLRLLA